MLSPALKQAAAAALHAYGDPGPLRQIHSVSGGNIGQAFHLETREGRYFFKTRADVPAGFFTAERDGLRELARGSRILRIPEVIAHEEPREAKGTGWILMEWMEPDSSGNAKVAETLGRGLAELHHTTASAFGLKRDNFIGLLPQSNHQKENWTEFYRDCRLMPQMKIARERNRLPAHRTRLLTRLMDRLENWLMDPAIRPALLHGDLWGGNWMVGPGGTPCLIDPAIYYGHWEVDLAFSELFGGFPDPFYDAYQEVCPLDTEYENRKPLYQLYYLLVHLNLFGETYGPSVDRVLKRYVG